MLLPAIFILLETPFSETSCRKKVTRTIRENIEMKVTYAGTKSGSQFNIKGPIPKKHNLYVFYNTVCLEENCIEDYYGECARRLEESTKDHNGRGKNTHVLHHSVESGHNEVSESDF